MNIGDTIRCYDLDDLINVKYNNNYGTARERQANALRGRPLSEEHKEKIRQSNIGKHNKTEIG